VAVARQIGCNPHEVESIRLAALLHDIGKIGLPTEIVTTTTDKLSELQKKVYFTHAVRGQMLLSHIEWLQEAGILIRHHHEQVNGSGTPDRLIGEEIPPGSRIIAIADFMDRSVSHATSGTMLHTTIRNLRNLAGRNFDQGLLPYFEEIAPAIFDKPKTPTEQAQIIPLDQLEPGMVLGEELYSGSRILLIDRGETVTHEQLFELNISLKVDPPLTSKVLVSRVTR